MSDSPDLVALVHGVAEQTVEFDELVAALMPMIRGDRPLAPEVALQLSTALIQIERNAAMEDELYGLVNEHGSAALALSEAGQILTLNTAAIERFSISTGDGLSALSITRSEFEEFGRRLSTFTGPTLIRVDRRDKQVREGERRKSSVLMSAAYHHRYRAFVLTTLRQYWPESVDRAMEELFGLSRSEREILALLAQGVNSEAIAERRFRSPGTVRQQIKSIMQKLGVTTQLEAATLAATAAATASATSSAAGQEIGLLPALEADAPLRFGTFFRGKRRVGWRRFGAPTGSKVLLLHGPSFGAGEYPQDRRMADRYGLDVYAIERPGYGRTDIPSKSEDVIDCHSRDITALLSRERLDRVMILAHEVALIPALELAHRHPGVVRGVLAVSAAPPFKNAEQIEAMPAHQGIFIQAARHAPWLARLMIRLLMVRTRQLGPERWTDVIFQGLQPDSRVIDRESLRPGVIGTYSFYLNQMGAGFEVDLVMMLLDWAQRVADPEVPLLLLHGTRNPATPPAALQVFRDLNPEITIELVEDAGLTLAVADPDLVYRRLRELIDDAPGTSDAPGTDDAFGP
jgi:pimeloyl-ACP methyl ester carboxylesterase/DNA-binding CsgD family transcriptional regulator